MQIRRIFFAFTDLVEPLSLDEAYLDVTKNRLGIPSATIIAREIKRLVKRQTGLTASAGASINKFLAKIASDYDKPDGLYVIPPEQAEAFVEELKIEQFWGVGKVTAEKMHRLGIHVGRDLKKFTERELVQMFGKAGHTYYLNARAIDDRPVEPDRERKSIGAEETFDTDIADKDELVVLLRDIADEVWRRISKNGLRGRTVTLKIKYADFKEISRRRTMDAQVCDFESFWRAALDLLDVVDLERDKIRLMGLTLSNFDSDELIAYRQLKLGFDEMDDEF